MQLEDAHALVIGISRYLHAPVLRTTQDAQDIAGALKDPACCGYPPGAVRTLIEEQATRAAIRDALDGLARTTREGSTVFVYYSGHGARAAAGGDSAYYLVPVDAVTSSRDELARTAISNVELSARLRAIPAGRLTLVLDCCRAADLADPQLAEVVEPLAQGRGRAVLAASRASDFAYALPGQRDSTLTGCLLDGLRGGAPGVGGVIRICDLFHYVQQRVAAGPVAQHPVFKAELEENYPIASYRAAPELRVPPAPDAFAYDAFVSYRKQDPGDRAWVEKVLVPRLEQLGLKLCLERRDFRLGLPRIREMERAVTESRYTLAVFTPAYLDGAFEDFQALLAQHNAIETRAPRFIPVLWRDCRPSLGARMTELLDLTDPEEVEGGIQRLALRLREPPHPRLG